MKNYLKVLVLSVFSFIAILLISRLEEIAEFAAMGAKLSYLGLFTLYQIPYILPIAIPISCLISAMILFQRLSHTHELTALRSGGIALHKILSPVLFVSSLLCFGNFYIASEMATSSHLAMRKMIYDLSSVNPLLLLQSAKIARLKNAFVQMDPIRNGETARNLLIAMNSPSGKRLTLILAKQVGMEQGKLIANEVSLICSSPAEQDCSFDHLIIENQKKMSSSGLECSKLLRRSGWKIANDHLKFSLLRIRAQNLSFESDKNSNRNLNKCRSEIIRRISLGLAAFTFTLLGAAFGMQIRRSQTRRDLYYVLALAAFCLIAFFMGKELDHLVWIASLLFLVPHVCIVLASLWTLRCISQGKE